MLVVIEYQQSLHRDKFFSCAIDHVGRFILIEYYV